MQRFPLGKVPASDLQRIVFRNLGVPNKRLLLGPKIGEDAAVVEMDDSLIVLSTDPITGALANIGWLSVHINANDVATRGARPVWYLCSIMLPEGSGKSALKRIMAQIDRASRELGITVVGGHSETTPLLGQPIIVGFMVGEVKSNSYVTSGGAVVGDKLVLTKTAGIEGTAIIANDHEELLKKKVAKGVVRKAQKLYERISVVKDAMIAMDAGGVSAMHDPTEGGVLCGVWELAEASHLGVRINNAKIPVSIETEAICGGLNIDPLRIMASGSLLVAAKPSSAARIVAKLISEGIPATEIGQFTRYRDGRVMIDRDNSEMNLRPPFQDEVYQVLNIPR